MGTSDQLLVTQSEKTAAPDTQTVTPNVTYEIGIIKGDIEREINMREPIDCKDIKRKTFYSKEENFKMKPSLRTDVWHHSHACNKPKCKTCHMWKPINGYITHQTNNKKIMTKCDERHDCGTTNVIYCLSCPICNMYYVGETSTAIRTRMSGHRSNITGQGKSDTIFYKHMKHAHNKIVTPELILLEVLPEKTTAADRRDCESEWIRILNATHPWGFNETVKGYGTITLDTDPLDRNTNPWKPIHFPKVVLKKHKTRTNTRRTQNRIPLQESLQIPQKMTEENWSLSRQFNTLMAMKTSRLWLILEAAIDDQESMPYSSYQKIASIYLTKHKTKEVTTTRKLYIPTRHVNNLSNIIPPEKIKRMLKKEIQTVQTKERLDRISFFRKMPDKLSRYAFNYSKFLKKLTPTDIAHLESEGCGCLFSHIADTHHKHIVTGDLSVLNDTHLSQVLSLGAGHRQIAQQSHHPVAQQAIETIQTLINIAQPFTPEMDFESIKITYHKLYDTITEKFIKYNDNTVKLQLKPHEDRVHTEQRLKIAHKRFVLVPIDKAKNNIGIICKKYYVSIINTELGLAFKDGICEAKGNATYTPTKRCVDEIIKEHAEYTKRICRTELTTDNRVIPTLWPTLKCHKNPTKFRFIAGARNCTMKQISVDLTKIYTMFKQHFTRYTAMITRQRGYSYSWSVKNSIEVIKKTTKTKRNNILTISDFSTLYTSFEHNTIIKCMTFLIELLFKHANKKYIAIGSSAYFHNSEANNRQKLSIHDILELTHYVINNSFVTHATYIFRQTKGVPMGGNASPLLADLCLTIMEYKYIHSNPVNARILSNTSRYIDDILVLNTSLLKQVYNDIYDQSLPLTFDDTSNGTGHFLDLQLNRNTGLTTMYDKRNDFKFKVIRFTHASSNCPTTVGTNTIFSQVLRIAKIHSNKDSFIYAINVLRTTFAQNGYKTNDINKAITDACVKHSATLRKFDLHTHRKVSTFLSTTPNP